MPDRRFPPPWIVEDSGAAFIAKTGTIVRRTQLRSTFENVPVLLKAPHVRLEQAKCSFGLPCIDPGNPQTD
jgi:hypothetical protein